MLDFTKGKPWKLLLQFSIPMLIGNVLMQLYNVVDAYIVGNYIGTNALEAVGASMPLIFALVSFTIGMATGCTIIISQYFGARNMVKVKQAIDTTTLFVTLAAAVLTVIGILLCDPLLKLVSTPDNVFESARTFFIISMLGVIPLFGVNCFSAILRGLGDSKTPLYFLIISSVVNIILVMMFVPLLGWGIAGAAWATVITQTLTGVALVLWLNRTHPIIHVSFRHVSFNFGIFRDSVRIGLPNGIQQMLVAVGMMAMLRIVNEFDQITHGVLAAYSVAGRIDSLATAPAMTFSIAVAAFVGQNVGARKLYRVKYGLRAALNISAAITVVLSVLIVIFGHFIMQSFAKDATPGVIDIGYRYLLIVGSFYVVFTSMFVVNGVMRGAGDTLIPMFITLLSLWLIRIPVASILSKYIGADGIWWSMPVGWAIGAICAYVYYRSGRWKNKGVAKPAEP
jgi:putative MATE family efflux protein